jgi:hypothetical protein
MDEETRVMWDHLMKQYNALEARVRKLEEAEKVKTHRVELVLPEWAKRLAEHHTPPSRRA